MDNKNLFCIELDTNTCIEKSTITYKWIVENLQDNSDDFRSAREDSKISKIIYEDISRGKGFISNVYKVIVYFDNKKKVPYQFVLKIPILNPSEMNNDIGLKDQKTDDSNLIVKVLAKHHNQEHLFYSKISNEVKCLKVPKYFGSCEAIIFEKSGAILMELIDKFQGEIIPIDTSFNIHQAKSVFDEILKLQIFSYTEGKHWKFQLQNKTNKTLAKIVQNMITTQWDNCKKFFPHFLLTEIEEEFENLLSNYYEIAVYHIYDLPEAQGNNSVICHGDLWINNILFCKDSKGRFTNDVKAIVDWQVIYEGAIGIDLARHLAVNCPPDIRRELEINYLPLYFNKLREEVMKKGESFKLTYESFKRIYDFCYIDQFFHIITTVGLRIVQLDMSKEDNDIWEARKFIFSSKIYLGIKDALEKVKTLKPEWLIKNAANKC